MVKQKNEWWQILWSLVVLVAILAFIYTIFFWIEKPDLSKTSSLDDFSKKNENVNIVYVQETAFEEGWFEERAPEGETKETQPVIQKVKIQEESSAREPVWKKVTTNNDPVVEQWKTFFSVQELFSNVEVPKDGMIPLSGTFLREWNLRSLVDFKMIEDSKYVLKTVYNSHFVYLWAYDKKTIPWIDELGWNIVEITDKKDIQWHGLFWDRIWFINTERYKAFDKVIFIVFFDKTNDARFIQMDRDRYYSAKPLIRRTFDQWYDW